MSKQQMEIAVGQKYAGYGVLNEYGEWTFIPSQVGSRQGQKKFVVGGNEYTIYSTKKKVIVHLTLDRGEKMSILKKLASLVEILMLHFKDYDFRCI